ncbi:MAG TPA: LysR family transcriptional regulator [Crenalkalicoccus sp.]|jgi:DNA-binding transcriptional LysR family regulator|nr:LysR family transcriptional regulator [Crenalkalicoccus sp.]
MDRLQQLSVFRRVVETGNVTRAARDLAMSQPNVSRILGELEERLGVPLLNRSPRGLTVTEAGQAFYSDALRILDQLDEAEARARGSTGALAGHIRLACASSFFTLVVLPWVRDFLMEHPQVSIEALLGDRSTDLVEQGADLAIRVGPLRQQSLVARRIGRVDLALFASASYLQRAGAPQQPEELTGHDFCTTLVGGRHPDSLTLEGPDGRIITTQVHSRFCATGNEATRLAVLSGIGIGLLAPWSVAEQVARGAAAPVLEGWRAEPRDVHIVWPAARTMPRRLRAFVDFIAQRAAAQQKLRAR